MKRDHSVKAADYILIVDDNEYSGELLKRLLVEDQHDVFVAKSGEEAVKFAKRHSLKAIFMDIMMPHMDGFEAAAQIRDLVGCRDVPIIACSAYPVATMKQKNSALGSFDDYIVKPIAMDTIRRSLGKLLG